MYNINMTNKIIIGVGILVVLALSYFVLQGNTVKQIENSYIKESKNTTKSIEKKSTSTIKNILGDKVNTKMNKARIKTNKGEIVIAFNSTATKTVENFQTLSSKGYYDGVRFHRVIHDFMIQTGDPLSKDKANIAAWGTGGPGYKFVDELSGNEKYTLGTVAMANSGPNTNGSQFFIVSTSTVMLEPKYTVFAKVLSGLEVVETIQNVKTTGGPTDRPIDDVIVEKVTLEN